MPKATKHANSAAAKIRAYLRANPTATPKKVAEMFNTNAQHVSVIKYGMKKAGEKTVPLRLKPKVSSGIPMPKVGDVVGGLVYTKMSNGKFRWVAPKPIVNPQIEIPITMEEPKPDPVNHPAHYKYGGIETIDFIEAKELGYNLGNVVKYITRSDHKGNRKQDLEKALWYLKRELEHSR
jgi:hypothetical protein